MYDPGMFDDLEFELICVPYPPKAKHPWKNPQRYNATSLYGKNKRWSICRREFDAIEQLAEFEIDRS